MLSALVVEEGGERGEGDELEVMFGTLDIPVLVVVATAALATSVTIPSERITSTLTASIVDLRGHNHFGNFEAVSSTAATDWNTNVGSSPMARPLSLIRLRSAVLSNHGASVCGDGDDDGDDKCAGEPALLVSCCCCCTR